MWLTDTSRSSGDVGVSETILKAYQAMNQFLSSFIERVSQIDSSTIVMIILSHLISESSGSGLCNQG